MKAKIAKLTGAEAQEFDRVIAKSDGYIDSINYLLSIGKLVME
jgi:hypothetical protein